MTQAVTSHLHGSRAASVNDRNVAHGPWPKWPGSTTQGGLRPLGGSAVVTFPLTCVQDRGSGTPRNSAGIIIDALSAAKDRQDAASGAAAPRARLDDVPPGQRPATRGWPR